MALGSEDGWEVGLLDGCEEGIEDGSPLG